MVECTSIRTDEDMHDEVGQPLLICAGHLVASLLGRLGLGARGDMRYPPHGGAIHPGEAQHPGQQPKQADNEQIAVVAATFLQLTLGLVDNHAGKQ